MKDRRKNLYCGPEHKLIPTFEVLANCLIFIEKCANDINEYNYGVQRNDIAIRARTAMAEVDKLIMLDCKTVEQKKEKDHVE